MKKKHYVSLAVAVRAILLTVRCGEVEKERILSGIIRWAELQTWAGGNFDEDQFRAIVKTGKGGF